MGKQSKQSSKSSRSAREAAAAARAASLAAEKRRQRTINIIIGAVIAIVVAGIVGGALFFANRTKEESGAVANPDAAAPAGAFPSGDPLAYGIPYGSDPDAVTLEVWEDFQCPACAAFETAAGANLKALADEGQLQYVTRVSTFLDRNLATDHSRRAAAAYGCAVDAGKGMEYKSALFSNQPSSEGDGWTDAQLVEFGSTAGIAEQDQPTFEQCFVDRDYLPWATNSTEQFYANGISGTPTVLIGGEVVDTADVLDPAKLQQLLDEAAAPQ